LEPTAQIWMKIAPYYQQQKCRPMTLGSGNIRFMQIFEGVPLSWGVKRLWGLSTTAIFGDLGGYVFENFGDRLRQTILHDDMLGHRTHCCWRMGCRRRPVNMEGATTHSRLCAAVSEWYAAPCRPVTDCKMNDLEWPWVDISCKNPFSATNSWIRAFECQKN